MIKGFPSRGILLPSAAILISLIYCIAPIMHLGRGQQDPLLLNASEVRSATRIVRALQGQPPGDAWIFEHRADPSPPEAYIERGMGKLGHLLRIDLNQLIVGSRVILPALAMMMMCFGLMSVGVRFPAASFAAMWFLLEADPTLYVPWSGKFLGKQFAEFPRWPGPLAVWSLFFVTFWAGVQSYYKGHVRSKRRWAWLTGVLAGSIIYVSPHAWFHLMVGFLFVTFATGSGDRWRIFRSIWALSFVFAIPFFFRFYHFLNSGGNRLISSVFSEYSLNRSSAGFSGVFLVFMLVISVSQLRFRQFRGTYLHAFILAGIVCLTVSRVSGVSLSDSVFHLTLAPVLYSGFVWALERWSIHMIRSLHYKAAPPILGALLMLIASFAVKSSMNWYGYAYAEGGGLKLANIYWPAWEWIRARGGPAPVILANSQTLALVPVRARAWNWVSPDTSNQLSLRFAEEIALRDSVVTAVQQGPLPGAPSPRKYRLDFLVRGPNEASWTRADDVFLLEQVFRNDAVRVDRIKEFK